MSEFWPPERVEKLVELAPLAYRVRDIAWALGVSKNSVIGKMRRMREKGVVLETHFGQQPKANAMPAAPKSKVVPLKPRRGLPPPDPVRPEPPLEIFTMRRLSLLELGPRSCRWPVGDPGTPEFAFCGNVTDADRTYCPAHHIVAHYRGNRP
jgi:GcrA cell cycle regulator